jgi:hypothetical protein
MDFIERLFGLSPDGGYGTFELSLMVLSLLALVLIWSQWRKSNSS